MSWSVWRGIQRTVILCGLLMPGFCLPEAWAATKTWDGGGANNLASTANNWNPDGVPAAGDVIVFDGTTGSNPDKNCSWDILAGYSVASMNIQSGYAGQVTLTAALIVTGQLDLDGGTFDTGSNVAATFGSYDQTGGTFNAHDSVITVNNGSFTHSGGTFNAQTSELQITGTGNLSTSATLFDLFIGALGGAQTVTLTSNIAVDNVLKIQEGADALTGGSYTVTLSSSSGNPVIPLVTNGGSVAGVGTINYTRTSGVTIKVAGTTYTNLGVGTTSDGLGAATFELLGDTIATGTVTIGHASSTNADILTTTASNHNLTAGAINITSKGTLTANSSTITLTNNSGTPLTVTGTLTETTGTTIKYTGTNGTVTVTSRTYSGHLTIDGSGSTFNAGGAIVVNGTMTVNAGTFSAGTSAMTLNGGSASNISALTVNNGGNYQTGTGVNTFGNASGDTVDINSGGYITIQSNDTTNDLVRNVSSANWNNNSNSTVTYSAANGAGTYEIRVDIDPYYNLTLDAPVGGSGHAYAHSAAAGITVNNDVTITKSQWVLGGASIVEGDVIVDDTLNLNGKDLTVKGGDLKGNGTVEATTVGQVTITGSGTLGNTDAGDSDWFTFNDLNIGAGTTSASITASGHILTKRQLSIVSKSSLPGNTLLGGSAWLKFTKATTPTGSGRPFLLGANNTTFTPDTSTVEYDEQTTAVDIANTPNFHHLKLMGAATYGFLEHPTIDGVLTIDADATLDAGTFTITLSGSGTPLARSGTFTASTSTVKYTSGSGVPALASAAMTGSHAFNNLTINGSGTFTANVAVEATNSVIVTTGTLAMGANNLTVGNSANTNSGSIKVASGQSLTQSSSNTTTIKSSASGANCIGSDGTDCAGTAGTITFGSLTIGDGSTTMTTTFGGTTPSMTVAGVLTVAANATFDGGSGTVTLSGSGTPFAMGGADRFTQNASTVAYTSGSGATVTATTYSGLTINGSGGIFTLPATLDVNGNLAFTAGTATAATNSTALTLAGNLTIGASGVFTKGGTVTFDGTTAKTWTDNNATSQDMGAVTINKTDTSAPATNNKVTLGSSAKATSISVDGTAGSEDRLALASSWSTLALTGTGTALNLNGADRLDEGTNANVSYEAASGSVNVTTATGYPHLLFAGNATFILGTAPSPPPLTASGGICIMGGTVDADTYDPNIAVSGDWPLCAAFGIALSEADFIKSDAGGTITLNGGTLLRDDSTTKSDFGNVVINTATGTLLNGGSVKVTSMTINNGKSLNISGATLTLIGTTSADCPGYPLCVTGTLTDNSSSTVEFAATSGTTTVNARTYGGGLKINGAGLFDTGGNLTVTETLTDSAGIFRVGTNHTVTAKNVTINGGTFSMPNSGGILKISGSGALSMSSGTWSSSDVATAPQLTTSDTGTPTYVGVSLTGGTLNIAELDVDYLKNTGFVIDSGVTLTAFDKVRWGSSGTWNGQAGAPEILLKLTAQTKNLLSHVFPTTWSNFAGGDCNVQANTSGTVTMWDWTGAFGGEENDCDTSGEVVWQGGVGGTRSGSGAGSGSYPAIY